MLKEREKSFDPPTAGRINVCMVAAGVLMVAVSLVVQYLRLTH